MVSIKEVPKGEIRSCDSCIAPFYNSRYNPKPKVDKLYEVRIGLNDSGHASACTALCEECLHDLYVKIDTVLN